MQLEVSDHIVLESTEHEHITPLWKWCQIQGKRKFSSLDTTKTWPCYLHQKQDNNIQWLRKSSLERTTQHAPSPEHTGAGNQEAIHHLMSYDKTTRMRYRALE